MAVQRFRGIAGSLAAALWVASCAVGPDFRAPAPPDVSRYTKEPLASRTNSTDTPGGAAQHFIKGRDIPGEWWRLFRSPALDKLVRQALKGNPTLQGTIAALRAAKETVYAQQGHYFPLVQGNYNQSRTQTPADLAPIPSSGALVFDLYTAQVLVSYVPDVWGLNRRTVEALQATADSQRFLVEAAYLTLTSNVVVAAISEASLRGQIDATYKLIDINKQMLKTLRQQFDTGYASRADLAAQEAALAQTEATLPPLRKALAVQRDALTALLGRYPSEEPAETFKLSALHLPEDLPVTLPSQLLQQRPDVRSAEELLHAASAQIGVATANMLPNVTISGNAGYTSTQFPGLISPANIGWSIAGNATQTIFDGLTLLHQRRAAEALYQQSAWTYRTTVITAMQNVADTLRALQNDADAIKAARDFERAAKISLDLARQQYLSGLTNIILYLNAQQTYQQAELALVQVQANRLSDTAALYQALGGGWWNRPGVLPELKLDVGTGNMTPLGKKHD
jgi:NodT family efflux transporter outer membrane factor (OMF) lipoprotein